METIKTHICPHCGVQVEVTSVCLSAPLARSAKRAQAQIELSEPATRYTQKCEHTAMKSFTFTDGQTARMCPDCTVYDSERRLIYAN